MNINAMLLYLPCFYKPIKIHWHIDVIKKCISGVIIPPGHIYAALLSPDGNEADS